MNDTRRKPTLPPHPVLTNHYASADDRVPYIRRLFDATATSYDRINAWMSLNRGEQYRLDMLREAGVGPGQRVLDVATGTGVLAAHAQGLVAPGGLIVAIDPSLPMLEVAARRGVAHRIAAIAEHLPIVDASFDLVSMGYALRHVADLDLTFRELGRTLRPGGRLMILEMVPPPSTFGYLMTKVYLKHLVPTLASVVTRSRDARRLMRYYWDTVDRCVPPEQVIDTLRSAGFRDIRRGVQLGILNAYHATWPPR